MYDQTSKQKNDHAHPGIIKNLIKNAIAKIAPSRFKSDDYMAHVDDLKESYLRLL